MVISQALNNALSGLNAAKHGAELASSNIANALTPGYGVRRLELSARDHGGLGAGVRIEGLTRQSDPFLLSERRLADANAGHHKNLAASLKQIEAWFGAVGSEARLTGSVARVEKSFISAATDPSSAVRLEDAVNSLSNLANTTRKIAGNLSVMRERAEQDILSQVDRLNSALHRIDKLNDDIVRLGQNGHPISGLYDQRQKIIDQISEIVPLRQISRGQGRIALMSRDGEMLVDHDVREIGFTSAGVITPDMTFAGGGLGGLTINGNPVPGGGATGLLRGGSLEAAFILRDKVTPDAQNRLDQFAENLLSRVSDSSIDTTIPPSGDGLLIAPRSPSAPGIVGLANALKLNPTLTTGSNPSHKLRDGLGATAPGPEGNAVVLRGWAESLQRSIPLSGGGSARSLNGHAADVSSHVSAQRVSYGAKASHANAARNALQQTELSHGVDTDQEMQMLMRLEQAYAANAKVMKTVNQMMRTILEI